MWLFWCIYFSYSRYNINTDVAFKNWAPFFTWKAEINNVFINKVNQIYIAMPMYNFIEYSDNNSYTSGSLWQFKRDEVLNNNPDLTADNFSHLNIKQLLYERQQMLLITQIVL